MPGEDVGLAPSVLHPVEHYQQRSHWDCGVSCVLMTVDKTLRDYILANFKEVCDEEGFGTSTWTIDLCFLLLRANVPITYHTITLGVDPNYKSQAFYNAILSKDTQRVTDRFESANSRGIKVSKTSTDTADIITHLANHGLVIVLTDANLLKCESCNYYNMSCIGGIGEANCLSWCSPELGRSYAGHYVAVIGYDLVGQTVTYRNPSLSDRECVMSFKDFDEARTAYGTDEDVIFIFNKSKTSTTGN